MLSKQVSRRDFVKASLSAVAVASLPTKYVFGQTTIRVRQEWTEFRSSPNYASFIDAVRRMRANTNTNDPASWGYWTNVHVNFCPHDIAYFLAWHRGYLYYFDQQLRTVSGNNNLTLPYWDYYRNPNIPSEFTDPATSNPLYVPRTNTNVYSALSLTPFGSTVWNFERGRTNAFEPLIESRPHNPVHNIIGGAMGGLRSPNDPIFYLHHANVDRLWHAWALPDGKGIPWVTAPYWQGSFSYATNLTLPRAQCYHPNRVGTDYANLNKPTSLPPQAQTARIIRVQFQPGGGRPALGDFPATAPRAIGNGRSLGGARDVVLTERSVSVRLPVPAQDRASLQSIAQNAAGRSSGGAPPSGTYRSVSVVLDNPRVLNAARGGGFFYNIYLNLPESGDPSSSEQHFLGTIGPFEIESASHHGAPRLSLQATDVLANVGAGDLSALTVSIVRVNGQNFPSGAAISIGELRVELSTEEPFDTSPHVPKPAGEPYR
ncbi:tyrosinase family protein [Noviherbaspirillum sp. ST9]|uniref:tyrosinase family protein n=1 Tax=Noviherbaspirillum sp. ST9 TaxID=3401606 RepID=UPI003B586472